MRAGHRVSVNYSNCGIYVCRSWMYLLVAALANTAMCVSGHSLRYVRVDTHEPRTRNECSMRFSVSLSFIQLEVHLVLQRLCHLYMSFVLPLQINFFLCIHGYYYFFFHFLLLFHKLSLIHNLMISKIDIKFKDLSEYLIGFLKFSIKHC